MYQKSGSSKLKRSSFLICYADNGGTSDLNFFFWKDGESVRRTFGVCYS